MEGNIQNQDIKKQVSDSFMVSMLQAPTKYDNKVSPVVCVNERFSTFAESATTTSATGVGVSLITADSTRDTYITSVTYAVTKNAACDVATGATSVYATLDNGIVENIAILPCITLTASSDVVSINYAQPLKVKRGTAVGIATNSITAGTMARTATITGFYVETMNKL